VTAVSIFAADFEVAGGGAAEVVGEGTGEFVGADPAGMALADNVASVVNAALSPVALLQPVGRVGLDPAMKLTAAHYHKLGS
jgi:hypothetical protein